MAMVGTINLQSAQATQLTHPRATAALLDVASRRWVEETGGARHSTSTGLLQAGPSAAQVVGGSAAVAALTAVAQRRLRRRGGQGAASSTARGALPFDRDLSAWDTEHVVMEAPVRRGAHKVALKRFIGLPSGGVLPVARPAVLLVHDGPGLPSRYLEPLAARLRAPGCRTCYLYDQLGCGLSQLPPGEVPGDGYGLAQSVNDLRDVLEFLAEELGETQIHVIGHGFGGALLMEALLRAGAFAHKANGDRQIPRLRSMCLMGTPSSSTMAEEAARRLMHLAEETVGLDDAVNSFWYRHICALKPQPACLQEAYAEAADRSTGWYGFGALQGWRWEPAQIPGGGRWGLQGGALSTWEVTAEEMEEKYGRASGGAPLLSIRGTHDAVTEDCVLVWRAVAKSKHMAAGVATLEENNTEPNGTGPTMFEETFVRGCGHHAHLEDPDRFAAKLRLWLLGVEDPSSANVGSKASPADVKAEHEDEEATGSLHLLDRTEARQRLSRWASELSWAAAVSGRRCLGDRRLAVGPSREARRLADWAWSLPQLAGGAKLVWPDQANPHRIRRMIRLSATRVAGQAAGDNEDGGTDAIAGVSADAQEARGNATSLSPRVALGLAGPTGLQAIVCVEEVDGTQASPEQSSAASPNLRVVGAAAAPGAPVRTREIAVRRVSALLSQAVSRDPEQSE